MHSKILRYLTLSILFLLLAFIPTSNMAEEISGVEVQSGMWKGESVEYLAGEILVGLESGKTQVGFSSEMGSLPLSIVRNDDGSGFLKLQMDEDQDMFDLIEQVKLLPSVQYAEPNFVARLHVTPNDLHYPKQWHYHNTGQVPPGGTPDADIDAPEGWDITTGSTTIRVGVLDTGIPIQNGSLSHPDLDDPSRYLFGYDFVNDDAVPADDNGHGTHVSGTIAAETDNGDGVSGVSWNAQIMAIKVFNSVGGGTFEAFKDGCEYAVDNGCQVISYSGGGPSYSAVLEDGVAYANDHGVIVCISAGNSSGSVGWPAAFSTQYSNCIAVSATDHNDASSAYSSIGPEVTIAAPGGYGRPFDEDDVYSTMPNYSVVLNTTEGLPLDYAYLAGTSMACPHVAGLAALLLSEDPTLAPSDVREIIKSTADDLGAPGRDDYFGWGRINVRNATAVVANPGPPDAPVLASPANDEFFFDVESPLLDWNDVLFATSYMVEIDNDDDFSSPRLLQEDIGVSEYQVLFPLLKATTYCWRVTGHNETYGYGSPSEVRRFDIRYAKPALYYPPDDYEMPTSMFYTLRWEKLDVGWNSYYIVVADDPGFTNVVYTGSTSANDCQNPGYCYKLIDPPLPEGQYWWRVRHNKTNFYYSDTRTFTLYSFVPSCPVLYSYDGNDFKQENPLLTACEQSGYTEVVTDYYQLTSPIAPRDGQIVFQLREMEDEITYLDDLELITVDHSANSNVGCTVDGQIFTYESSVSPISAVDQDGVDRIEAVGSTDDALFTAVGSGYLTLTFPNTGSESGICFGAPRKIPCPHDPGTGGRSKMASQEQSKPNSLTVEQLSDNGNWIRLPNVPTRANATGEFVMSDALAEQESSNITIRLSWEGQFSTDEIRQYVPSDEAPMIRSWKVNDYQLDAESVVAKTWTGFTDPKSLELRKDESIEFSFDVDEISDPSLTRDYVLRSVGRYQPDYSVYTHLLPNQFQLYSNYPNPFNPTTTISFDLPKAAQVKLEIINILGQCVNTLIDETQSAGHFDVVWNGKSENGSAVASGIYFYRLTAGDFVESRKMTLLK